MIKVNDAIVEIGHFPDGTIAFKRDNMFDVADALVSKSTPVITWKFENNEEMTILLFLVGYLKNHGCKEIDLYMPYIPNARMDRVKDYTDVFTLKFFCEFINSLNFL